MTERPATEICLILYKNREVVVVRLKRIKRDDPTNLFYTIFINQKCNKSKPRSDCRPTKSFNKQRGNIGLSSVNAIFV